MSLEEGIRKARDIDLTEKELHSTIKNLNLIGNKIIHGDNMKTFQDIIDSSNTGDVIKKYIINGIQIKLEASHFMGTNSVIKDGILCTVEKINNILLLKFSCYCTFCEGTGQYDCEECNGDGDTECFECGTSLTCDYCNGDGTFDCDCEIIEDEIIFEDRINLNQGELFNSHFNI